jgi:hypothetical protein
MIAMTTKHEVAFAVSGSVAKGISAQHRRITPEIGRALEKLGHAIEYLTDEMRHEGDRSRFSRHQLEALHLLMDFRRQIYQEAPEVPPLVMRCRALLKQLVAPAS